MNDLYRNVHSSLIYDNKKTINNATCFKQILILQQLEDGLKTLVYPMPLYMKKQTSNGRATRINLKTGKISQTQSETTV